MDKAQALHTFWSGFGLPAIDEQSAYDTAVMEQLGIDFPYISYEAAVGDFDEPVALSADLWYKSTSWAEIEAKAAEIAQALKDGGTLARYDRGAIWITRGNPITQRMSAENPFDIRRIHININAEFLSA